MLRLCCMSVCVCADRCCVCREVKAYSNITDIPLNYTLMQSLEHNEAQRQQLEKAMSVSGSVAPASPSAAAADIDNSAKNCCDEKCEETPTLHCENCDHDYCQQHCDEDHSTARLKQHRIIPIESKREKPLVCDKHMQPRLVFCKQCKVLSSQRALDGTSR